MAFLFTSCADDLGILENQENVQSSLTSSLKKTCGSHKHMQNLLDNPEYKSQRDVRMAAFNKLKSNASQKTLCGNPTIIPVAVHYQGISNPNASCLIDLAKRQVNVLNADFQGKNSDINQWINNASASFPNINFGETCIKFCIADQNHPTGYGISNGQPAITINKTQGDQVNNWSGYLNIYVQVGTGALGYAPLGGAGNGDGVVIEATAFGAGQNCGNVGPEAPYNLGRTTTHEVGHYLLLDHIWGEGCNIDDDVADTPSQGSENGGCPIIGIKSCGTVDLHMNYMDYTDDECMYMFTNGQSQRMETYINSSLAILKNNAENVCSEAAQNGSDENSGDNGDGDNPDVCDTPSSTQVDQLTEASAHIVWKGTPGAKKYQLMYRVKGASWKRVKPAMPEATIEGLLPDTKYQYRIRTRCDFGWTPYTAIQTFTTTSGSEGDGNGDEGDSGAENNLTVEIILDDFGSETSWYILNDADEIISQGGPYRDGIRGKVKRKDIILLDGCFVFIVEDYYGDGICCKHGDGSAKIVNSSGNTVVESDGQFGFYDEIGFCIQNGSVKLGKRKADVKSKNLARKSLNK